MSAPCPQVSVSNDGGITWSRESTGLTRFLYSDVYASVSGALPHRCCTRPAPLPHAVGAAALLRAPLASRWWDRWHHWWDRGGTADENLQYPLFCIRSIFALHPPYIRPMFALCPPYIRPTSALCPPYIRPVSAGDDTYGDGTVANPYASIQRAVLASLSQPRSSFEKHSLKTGERRAARPPARAASPPKRPKLRA